MFFIALPLVLDSMLIMNKCNMLIFDAAWGFDIFSLSSCRVEMIQEIHCII